MHASFSFYHFNLQLAYATQVWILKFKNLCHASKHMKCIFKCTIQVHELALPTCVLKILIDPFPFLYLSPYVICQDIFTFLSLFHYLCFSLPPLFLFVSLSPSYLCFSPPLSSMTTKVLNVDSITCRVKIINVNQWGEDNFPKFGLV